MIKGFSLLEVIVTLSLSVLVLSIILSNVAEAAFYSKKVTTCQQKMESIFHTVDSIKSDLTKCGTRIQDASVSFGFPMFENSSKSFKVVYGMENETLLADCANGGYVIWINKNEFFSKSKKILIYDSQKNSYEFNTIKATSGGQLTLTYALQNNYSKNSSVVSLKEVEYMLDTRQKELKRKVNNGYFQPLMENVTDFFVQFITQANAVYYRIEVNNKEQIRGYVFLTNTVNQ